MQRTIVTPPTYFAVSLDEIKDHLRVTHTDDDPYIQALLMTAQGQVESYLNRKLITQTWKAFFDDWPDGDAIVLPFGQLQSVTNVKYTDSDGDQSTFSSDDYIASQRFPAMTTSSTPTASPAGWCSDTTSRGRQRRFILPIR